MEWLLYVPHALTTQNEAFGPHIVFTCSVEFVKYTEIQLGTLHPHTGLCNGHTMCFLLIRTIQMEFMFQRVNGVIVKLA